MWLPHYCGRRLGLRHTHPRLYIPHTNGKAERFIQTILREWEYVDSYVDPDQRAAHLNPWSHEHNQRRCHASLGYKPPITRIPMS